MGRLNKLSRRKKLMLKQRTSLRAKVRRLRRKWRSEKGLRLTHTRLT